MEPISCFRTPGARSVATVRTVTARPILAAGVFGLAMATCDA